MKSILKCLALLSALIVMSLNSYSQTWNIPPNGNNPADRTFIGTVSQSEILFRTQNKWSGDIGFTNVLLGLAADSNISRTGASGVALNNTAIGFNALLKNVIGNENTAVGAHALEQVTNEYNTAVGAYAFSNGNGAFNVAIGDSSLRNNSGEYCVGIGNFSLNYNSGDHNIAIGYRSLFDNGFGNSNIAIGQETMDSNRSGSENVAVGLWTLKHNASKGVIQGNANTALGTYALTANICGSRNVAIGHNALAEDTTGEHNVCIGSNSGRLYYDSSSVFIGDSAGYGSKGSGQLYIANNTTFAPLISGNFATATQQGKIAINSSLPPAATLDVAGNIKITDGMQSANLVLTCIDNTGLAKWAAGANYTAGVGINITGNVISNTAPGSFDGWALTSNGQTNTVNNTAAGGINIPQSNTSFGMQTLNNPASGGFNNTAIGANALSANLGANNTALGVNALSANHGGNDNIGIGVQALQANTEGWDNIAIGRQALFSNIGGHKLTAAINEGSDNIAIGSKALFSNQSSSRNVAVGTMALTSNVNGSNNTATGYLALAGNTIGNSNTAMGVQAATSVTEGWNNTAVGYQSLFSTLGSRSDNSGAGSGLGNTAIGEGALFSNVSGNYNVALGTQALNSITDVFQMPVTDGRFNTALGSFASPGNVWPFHAGLPYPHELENWTGIGFAAGGYAFGVSLSNMVEVGNSSVWWIGGEVNWKTYSDERIKDSIRANVPGLSFINLLRPVTYHLNVHRQNELVHKGKYGEKEKDIDWDGKYDIEKITMSGFIAQEVEKAAQKAGYDFSGIQHPDKDGLYSIGYSDFVVPLVKSVQEQQQQIENQQKQINELKKQNELLLSRLDKLDKNK